MRRSRLLGLPAARTAWVLLVAVAVAGCGDDDGAEPHRDESGCPVAVDFVAEQLGYDVAVVDAGASRLACRYEPVDRQAHPGAHVLVVERDIVDDGGFEAVLSGVHADASGVEVYEGDTVADVIEGAERGWVATLGRVVQVGASTGSALFQVTVADADLPVEQAREVALALVADVLR